MHFPLLYLFLAPLGVDLLVMKKQIFELPADIFDNSKSTG